jgi:short-subunit dehydrogenase involved in D-alanine esterification of teichoic acids
VEAHPDLDSLLLSTGIQRPLDFYSPQDIDLDMISTELTTNYLSHIHLLVALLPQFLSLSLSCSPNPNTNTKPKSIIFISSALGLVPIPKVAGYCASKAFKN